MRFNNDSKRDYKSNLYMLSMMKMVMAQVSDEELSHIKEIKQTETQFEKNLAQLRDGKIHFNFYGCFYSCYVFYSY